RLAVDREDDVARLEPGLVRGAALLHRLLTLERPGGDAHALAGVGLVDRDADARGLRHAGVDQLLGDAAHLVRRDGEAEADVAALAAAAERRDRRVHPDHLAGGVDQRAAGVTGVDRRVGLDRVDPGDVGAALAAGLHRPVDG